jgi:site-specific DNA-methyltransferase (adenine-specific)
VLKDTGTIWVIGSYHNIYRVGAILMNLGYWILNDVVWIKANPMPQMRGVRFANAHETLLWAKKSRKARYTFNYHAMKELNDGKQMRSDWLIPICGGAERIKVDGKKAHSTQKPEALLYRVLVSSSDPGDVVLDPFFGSGTTGAVAKRLHRNWIGIERDPFYVEIATQRISAIRAEEFASKVFDVGDKKRSAPRVEFARLVEHGLVAPGQTLYFRGDRAIRAQVKPDGRLVYDGVEGSIHQLARHIQGSPCNGWEHWYFENGDGALTAIDALREQVRKSLKV